MSATYDINLSTSKDAVRLLIGDTNVSNPALVLLQNEEIAAIIARESQNGSITGQALEYFAAATCLESVIVLWAGKGKGKLDSSVAVLSVHYGLNGPAADILQKAIELFRLRANRLISGRGSFAIAGYGIRTRNRVFF